VFTAPNHLNLDHWQVFHQGPGRMAGMFSARNNTEARVILGFQSPPLELNRRDTARQKQLVADTFAGMGWETPRLLKAMWNAPDFYFDSMSQIFMDRWWSGRTVLVGDAGYCGSPMSGQGTSMAMVGAYVLAGELKAAGGDLRAALPAYEERLRGFVHRNQSLASPDMKGPPPREAMQEAANAIRLVDYRS
jgi:2-polyprenyl-6-methoxyphenol hydroxylase-like FAD-dependent oxidoreductase